MARWAWLWAALLGAGACRSAGSFACETDEQCTPSGLGGSCEATGFCSFPDPACGSGRRYAGHAGAGLANTCVDDPTGTDAPDDIDPLPDAAAPDGADAPPGCLLSGSGCLELPTAPISVVEGALDPPANYACAPESTDLSTATIHVSGTIRDGFGAGPRAGAGVATFRDVLTTMPLVNDTANLSGDYDIILPVGTPDFLHWKITHSTTVDSYVLNDVMILSDVDQPGSDFAIFTAGELGMLADFAEVNYDAGRLVYFADLYDCDGNGVEHAIGILSARSGVGDVTPVLVEGAVTVYLDDAYTPAPRASRIETNGDGHFYVWNARLPNAGQRYFLQAWGFLDDAGLSAGLAGLRLLSEFEVPAPGPSFVRVGMRATEGPLP